MLRDLVTFFKSWNDYIQEMRIFYKIEKFHFWAIFANFIHI
jgi:hypothetical protein